MTLEQKLLNSRKIIKLQERRTLQMFLLALVLLIALLLLALDLVRLERTIDEKNAEIKTHTEEAKVKDEYILKLEKENKELAEAKAKTVTTKTEKEIEVKTGYSVSEEEAGAYTVVEDFIYYDLPEAYINSGGMFSEPLQKYAYILCEDYKFDFAILLAMIETETGYRADAVSEAGAKGYMQIIPKYHKEKIKEFGGTENDITDPYLNIKVGLDYIASLQEKYGDMDKALTAYCFGEAGAKRYVWDKGLTSSDYSNKVLKRALRIRAELNEIKEQREGVGK